MKWQMFYMPANHTTRHANGIIRLHYLRDTGTSVGYVEQTQVREGSDINVPATFRVHMNLEEDYLFNPEGTEVPDLEAGMALVKILHNPSNH
jgi:hypothetical protein